MIYNEKKLILKDGREAVFRSPLASDAPAMLDYLKITTSETDFLLRYPEEFTVTAEQEAKYLENINASDTDIMIVCTVEGEIAGNCQLQFRKLIKMRHRATVSIALIKKYWGLGIGSAMFSEMISIAKARGVLQLELDYIEGNERAKALYEKMGFVQISERPNAFRMNDGTFLKEISMIKLLS